MDARLSVPKVHLSVLYNIPLLEWRRDHLKLTHSAISALIGIRRATVTDVFQGRALAETAYKVACALGLNWALVSDTSLPEDLYYLAVRYAPLEGRQLIAPQEASSNSP